MTSDGTPIGWIVDGDGDGLYVRPNAGLLRGCDSWVAPSWGNCAAYKLDETKVVGVGEATVVLAPDTAASSLAGAAREGEQSEAESTDSSKETEEDETEHLTR